MAREIKKRCKSNKRRDEWYWSNFAGNYTKTLKHKQCSSSKILGPFPDVPLTSDLSSKLVGCGWIEWSSNGIHLLLISGESKPLSFAAFNLISNYQLTVQWTLWTYAKKMRLMNCCLCHRRLLLQIIIDHIWLWINLWIYIRNSIKKKTHAHERTYSERQRASKN